MDDVRASGFVKRRQATAMLFDLEVRPLCYPPKGLTGLPGLGEPLAVLVTTHDIAESHMTIRAAVVCSSLLCR